MGLRLPDRWIWDSWFVWENDALHAFYLCASRSLGNPDRRHRYTSVGHAVTKDMVNWEILPDALAPSDSPAFDSWTTWTGSTLKGPDGLWYMFYTGSSREDGGDIQRIGYATSRDLIHWEKQTSFVLEADPQWYEQLDKSIWHDQAWRDPWVFRGDDGQWHMLITARAKTGHSHSRGVVGHATSADLKQWKVNPPVSEPGNDFGQLEVLQYEVVDGVPLVIFCCGWRELGDERQAISGWQNGIYSLPAHDLKNLDLSKAELFSDTTIYAARLVQKDGEWYLIGFLNDTPSGFLGELCDPIPVTATWNGNLVLRENVSARQG
jgi:beta-fructofuranosidase